MDDMIPYKAFDPSSMTNEELHYLGLDDIAWSDMLMRPIVITRKTALPQIGTTLNRPSSEGLGKFDCLPYELQHLMLSRTPLRALFTLRSTNYAMRRLIDNWPPFKRVMTLGGYEAVQVLVGSGAGDRWTASDLDAVLFTTKCELCGQHGEILQLLKLMRCCFRCLSEDRRLLAVSELYAKTVMGLTREELKAIPHIKTISQGRLWGNVAVPQWAFDFTASLQVLARRQTVSRPKPLHNVPRHEDWVTAAQKVSLFHTDKSIAPEKTSIQPRYRESLHVRRRRVLPPSKLALVRHAVAPPECEFIQHQCAFRTPALRRRVICDASGAKTESVTPIYAVSCKGCSDFWNLHSNQPVPFHPQYPHTFGKKDTPFTEHLKHCIYAHMLWEKLHPGIPQSAAAYKKKLSEGSNFSRHLVAPQESVESVAARWEKLPSPSIKFALQHATSWDKFVPPCEWKPVSHEYDPGSTNTASLRISRKRKRDEMKEDDEGEDGQEVDRYADVLFGQAALSQAGWATCRPTSAQNVMAGAMTMVKRAKLDIKRAAFLGIQLDRCGFDDKELGFDHIWYSVRR